MKARFYCGFLVITIAFIAAFFQEHIIGLPAVVLGFYFIRKEEKK